MSVVVVTVFRLQPGREAAGRAEDALRDLVDRAHGEAGCQTYAIHRDREDPRALVTIGRWTSPVAYEAHGMQPYAAALSSLGDDVLEQPPEVRVLDPLPAGDPMKGSL